VESGVINNEWRKMMDQCESRTRDGSIRCQGVVGHGGQCFVGGVLLKAFDRPQEPVVEVQRVLSDVEAELASATSEWPAFNSAHEGFAVLAEEVDELWDHVKINQKRRDLAAMRREAVQVAAMAVRFAAEVCDEERGRK
jgi:NTP pyrophosphatase (non-canonical NTP hydrolase)